MAGRTPLSPAEYEAICTFLEKKAGIRLGPGKEYLVSSRLERVLGQFQLGGFGALGAALRAGGDMRVQARVVDAMTTNETFWFRDAAHYRALTHDILKDGNSHRVRIWCAAVSTGQEAYSIAISLKEAVRDRVLSPLLRYEILGTDISTNALNQARAAGYCGAAASRGLSDTQRRRYFRSQDDCIEVLPEYREGIALREFNLLQSFDVLGRFDVIFCRNVLIYFSQQRKREIVERFARALNPGGYLILGSTESMADHNDLYDMRSLAGGLVYRRR